MSSKVDASQIGSAKSKVIAITVMSVLILIFSAVSTDYVRRVNSGENPSKTYNQWALALNILNIIMAIVILILCFTFSSFFSGLVSSAAGRAQAYGTARVRN